MKNLIIWDKAKQAIEEARSVDEVKDIRDRAEAFRLYARQARESLEVQNKIAEIKLRCEKRIGEMTKEMPKFQGKRTLSDHLTKSKALKEAGFNREQVSRFETIASLPEKSFEQYVAEVKASHEELLTTTGMVKFAKRLEGKDTPRTECDHRWLCTKCGLKR